MQTEPVWNDHLSGKTTFSWHLGWSFQAVLTVCSTVLTHVKDGFFRPSNDTHCVHLVRGSRLYRRWTDSNWSILGQPYGIIVYANFVSSYKRGYMVGYAGSQQKEVLVEINTRCIMNVLIFLFVKCLHVYVHQQDFVRIVPPTGRLTVTLWKDEIWKT